MNRLCQKWFVLAAVLAFKASTSMGNDCKVQLIPQRSFAGTVLNKIQSAQSRVLIAHYIYNEDMFGNSVTSEIIKLKSQRKDVEVKVITDGIGAGPNFNKLSPVTSKYMQTFGAEVRLFNPISASMIFGGISNRMHMKIVIVDNTLILGSSGIWEGSCGGLTESDVIVEDPAVVSAAVEHFATVWKTGTVLGSSSASFDSSGRGVTKIDKKTSTDPLKAEAEYFADSHAGVFQNPKPTAWPDADCQIRYVGDAPLRKSGTGIGYDLLNRMKVSRKVVILNPYYLPTQSWQDELMKMASNVGISVWTNSGETIGSELSLMQTAYESRSQFMNKAKIDVYEGSGKTFLHSKIVLFDDSQIYVGSFNLDPLGIDANIENGIIVNADNNLNPLVPQIHTFIGELGKDSRLRDKNSRPAKAGLWQRFLHGLAGSYL